jgi:hypothetical protein
MRRSSALTGILTLLAWGTAAARISRPLNTYVPKNALACERAVTHHNAPKHCKNCNAKTTVGAADSVVVQLGGCGDSVGQLATVASFTSTAIKFYQPVEAPSLNVGALEAGDITAGDLSVDALTVGDLIVTGTSVHEGLETFNGGIATNVIYSTDPDDVSVQIPGSGADSTQIGPDGKGNVCLCVCWSW